MEAVMDAQLPKRLKAPESSNILLIKFSKLRKDVHNQQLHLEIRYHHIYHSHEIGSIEQLCAFLDINSYGDSVV